MPKQPVEMEISMVKMEIPDTKTIRLKWPDGYDVDVKTGQFVVLSWPDAPVYKRAYSLSSSGLDRGFFEVTVKREGKMGIRIVDWAKVGDRLMVTPPAGRFVPIFEEHKRLICIAGGSGVVPFRGFVREATQRQLPTPITLLYSVRTTNEIIFQDEFHELAQQNHNFNFYVTCTRMGPEGSWMGRYGRISAEWIGEHIHDLPNTIFYACGPNELVEAIEKLVIEDLKVPQGQMRTEKWG